MSNGDINTEDESGKLFVGGLSWETTKESLSEYFSNFGEVVDCVVMKNNDTGKSRGFGFITFKDPHHVDDVLSKSCHTLDNRTIDPKACNPRSVQLKKKNNNFKVFLGGLPNNITESEVQAFFSNYGNVTEVVIMYDQEKKKCRGFGFLSFDTEEAVKRACDDHYVHIKGKQVECKMAQKGLGKGGMNNNQGMQQGMNTGPWNPMGGQMSNNGMGGMNNSGYQGAWAGQQPGGFQGGFNQGPGQGFQNYSYGNAQQQQYGGPQGFGNYGGNAGGNYGYGNYGMQGPGPNGTQGGNNQPGPGYNNMNSGGPGMGQNQMGGPGMNQVSGYGNNNGNMGCYPHEASNFGPSRGFGGGPMGHGGMQNSGFLPQGGYNNAPTGNYDASNHQNVGPQGEGPPGGRGGAQQNAGYHPYRR